MKKLLNLIPIIFSIMIVASIIAIIGADFFNYYLEREFILPNLITTIIAVALCCCVIFVLSKLKITSKQESLTPKQFLVNLVFIFLTLYLLQLFILSRIYFYTNWDVKVVLGSADYFLENGSLGVWEYTSMYPNNLLIIFILALIKMVPVLGQSHFFLLAINALIINLAGFFTVLTIKRLISYRGGILSLLLIIPLLVLSPWMIIPYTDSFAVLLPILILFIYSKKQKRWWDYLLIGLITGYGYYIKPTIIIITIAILIVELLNFTKKHLKTNWKSILKTFIIALAGIVLGACSNPLASKALGFIQDENYHPFTFTHYLAMGQFDERLGMFNGWDVADSITHDDSYNIQKFWNRLASRTPAQQLKFWVKKLSLNYNDGTFGWGNEGNFYNEIPEHHEGKITNFLQNLFYNDGKYYPIYALIMHLLWIFTLVCCVLTIRHHKNYSKPELVGMLSLIGLTIFLMIFEPRTRYLFCYLPVFIVVAATGLRKVLKPEQHN